MLKIKIPGMMCAHCENAIRTVIKESGGSIVSLDLATKMVALETPLTKEQTTKLLYEVGFDIEFLN